MKAVFNWSGGKDSALAVYRMMQAGEPALSCLLTTVNESFGRVSMHGVRTKLLEMQAESIGLPLVKVMLPEMPDMATYERIMEEQLRNLKGKGVDAAVFGDIFLEDLRKYREQKLSDLGIKCLFPIWQIPTNQLIMEFIGLGFKAITVCVDEKHLDRTFAGRTIDESFVRDLPATVDPCGENGEFHSFVFDGPIFRKPVVFETGEIVYRRYSKQDDRSGKGQDNHFETGFWYCDLLPAGTFRS